MCIHNHTGLEQDAQTRGKREGLIEGIVHTLQPCLSSYSQWPHHAYLWWVFLPLFYNHDNLQELVEEPKL